jgi:hypothetical protein
MGAWAMRRSGSRTALDNTQAPSGDGGGDGDARSGTPSSGGEAKPELGRTAAFMLAAVPLAAILSHVATPKAPDGRELSEASWYSVDVVRASQERLGSAGLDDFLSLVSSASSPSQILNRVVPLLACLRGPQVAIMVLVAYVAADVSNLALKWPLQGDRPFWMDPSLRQFGGNTCEVGFGMPSGHVQVTFAAYLTVADAMGSKMLQGLVVVIGLLTALSRVHMAAHTPLQVTCGCIAGLSAAMAVRGSRAVILHWGSHRMPNSARLLYAVALVIAIALFIALENALLLALGVEIYASIANAMAACRGGLHAVVSSARGIGRDVGALLGGVVGVCCRYSLGGGVVAVGRWSWLDLVVAIIPVEAGLWLSTVFESMVRAMFHASGAAPPDVPGGGGSWMGVLSPEEGAATVAIFAKYFLILALGAGAAPLVLDHVRRVLGAQPTSHGATKASK